MKRRIEKHVTMMVWLTLCVMAVVRLLFYSATTNKIDTSYEVEYSRETLAQMRGLMVALLDVETNRRGYLVTGQDSYLQTYSEGLKGIPPRFKSLEDRFTAAPNHLDQFKAACGLTRQVILPVEQLIELRRSTGFDAAREIELIKATMDEFRRRIGVLQNEETADLSAFAADAHQARRRGLMIFAALTSVDLLVLSVTFYFLRRYARQRDQAQDDLIQSGALRQTIMDNANTSIIAVDPEGIIRVFNHAAERWLGWSAQEVIGRETPMIWHDPAELAERAEVLSAELGQKIKPGFETVVARAGAGIPQREEWTYVARNGRRFPVLLAVSALRGADGELTGFVGIASDISEQKRAQMAMQSARDAAEAASRTKSLFLANMSHELRTPLNAIIGYSEMLAEDASASGQQQLIEDLGRINQAGKHLLDLINDILDLSKVEAGKMRLHLESVSVPILVQDVVGTLRPMMAQNQNTLNVHIDSKVESMRSDPGKVRQVLLNLLSNASKFGRGGEVSLSVQLSHNPADSSGHQFVEFIVRDRGIGITDKQMERLFEAFAQADPATSSKYGGTGLGLAISREYCRMMGGGILASSEPGKGSTFTARLPLEVRDMTSPQIELPRSLPITSPNHAPIVSPAPPNDPSETQALSVDDAGSGGTILVVDDDPPTQDLMRRMLEPAGYTVLSALSGPQALALAREVSPVAITLDLLMPGMDGWTVLETLKADSRTADIPVIVVSVVDDPSRARSLGSRAELNKPVNRVNLIRTLEPYRRPAS